MIKLSQSNGLPPEWMMRKGAYSRIEIIYACEIMKNWTIILRCWCHWQRWPIRYLPYITRAKSIMLNSIVILLVQHIRRHEATKLSVKTFTQHEKKRMTTNMIKTWAKAFKIGWYWIQIRSNLVDMHSSWKNQNVPLHWSKSRKISSVIENE